MLRRAEETADSISLEISRSGLSDYLPKSFSENFSLSDLIGRSFTVSVEAVLGGLVAFFAGVFIASEPKLYSEGFTLLFAPRWRNRARETLGHVSTALRRWLLGQMIEMVTVGVMSGVAVWLIGLPSPFALGAISGLSEFIPYIGPILAIFPSVAVAATIGPYTMLWTILAYLAIHQLDGNMIMPLIQRQLVRVPPALMLDFDRDVRHAVRARRDDFRRAADGHHLCRGDQALCARYAGRVDAAAGGEQPAKSLPGA